MWRGAVHSLGQKVHRLPEADEILRSLQHRFPAK
jgi:hypothetical protein